MKQFFKLNAMSMLYALMIFVPVELMVNVYRISRLTGWELATVNTIINVTIMVELVVGTIIFLLLTKRFLNQNKSNYITVILWLMYYYLFIKIFAHLFPITYGGDQPNPVTGLLIIGAMIIFPIYIAVINFVGSNLISGSRLMNKIRGES